ncbi:MAG: hypothetical protein ACRD5R_02675 [Candidatus Acidiferrales bacterium]
MVSYFRTLPTSLNFAANDGTGTSEGMLTRSHHAEQSSSTESRGDLRALPLAARFFRLHAGKILAVSALLLIPCFWHAHIEAGDLASHVYNAWLAQLIEQGGVNGLTLVHAHQNVLFDYLLGGSAHVFGMRAAEKISVSLTVLILFWGAFAFIAAATRRAPWFLAPLVAMLAYGWTFELGFFNYYLSIGLSFFGLAIFWRGYRWERLWFLALAPLVLLAHAMGLVWMMGCAAYLELLRRIPRRRQLALFLAGAASIVVLRWLLFHFYIADPPLDHIYFFTGADQLVLFGSRYWLAAAGVLAFCAFAFAADFQSTRKEGGFWDRYGVVLQLYALTEIGVFLLPDGIHFPEFTAALALIIPRLTLLSAILLCCVLGVMRPRLWHLAACAALAAIFFSLLYQDTRTIARMEAQTEHLIQTIPPGSRVLATILRPPRSRVLFQHIVDRACIGRCFSYGNYEASSGAFRIHVTAPNPYVMSENRSTAEMEEGDYTVEPGDLPAYQIYQCSAGWTQLCIRPLEEGEDNDRTGIHPGRANPPE